MIDILKRNSRLTTHFCRFWCIGIRLLSSSDKKNMSLFSRFFYKRPPDGLLEFVDRVYGNEASFSSPLIVNMVAFIRYSFICACVEFAFAYFAVFDSCFTTEVLPEEMYQLYLHEIITELHEEFPESSFLAFNFREGEKRSQFAEILCEYDVTVMDYPRHYEGCPLSPTNIFNPSFPSCL